MSTPTPRTDKTSESLLSKTFLTSYVTMQELARTLERELAAERARMDWLELRGPWDSWNGFGETGITLRENIRAVIDAAIKEETK